MTEYVVGFLHDGSHVALIEKKRPEWQKGRLNGIGGHIEQGEMPIEAMRREFHEEADLAIDSWELTVIMTGENEVVYVFAIFGPVWDVVAKTDEQVYVERINGLSTNVLPNLRWLIPMSMDTSIVKPVRVSFN